MHKVDFLKSKPNRPLDLIARPVVMSPILIPENAFTAQEFDQVRVRMWTMVTERLEGQAFARECPAQGHDIS